MVPESPPANDIDLSMDIIRVGVPFAYSFLVVEVALRQVSFEGLDTDDQPVTYDGFIRDDL